MRYGFKKRKGLRMPYDQQGLIYFTCKTYKQQPRKVQEKILRLCERAGGENAEALFCYLTTHTPMTEILNRYFIASDSTVHRMVRVFFESWGK